MNKQHLKMIADHVHRKLAIESAQEVPGGPGGGHICWKIKSDKETFFIKQLDPTLDMNLEKNYVEAALNGMYGSTINWLLYNINLVCHSNDQDRKATAITEISNSLSDLAQA